MLGWRRRHHSAQRTVFYSGRFAETQSICCPVAEFTTAANHSQRRRVLPAVDQQKSARNGPDSSPLCLTTYNLHHDLHLTFLLFLLQEG